jgi:glutathione synthase/RimK-type ligase-like ATP-grasp enzyme
VAWDDPAVDWSAFDLAVLRSTWDYTARREEFLTWAAKVPGLVNPAEVVAWNTDKRYLATLQAAGIPIVPTTWLPPGNLDLPAGPDEIVVKPTVGAGGRDAGRYRLGKVKDRWLAGAHVGRLHKAGRTVMIQPYLSAVDTAGETAVLFLHSPETGELTYSHAIRKGPLLDGPDVGVAGLYREEEITPRTPSEAELDVAHRAVAALPNTLLYARIDLIPGPDGAPMLIELELTEPSLFLGTAPGAPHRLAAAISALR